MGPSDTFSEQERIILANICRTDLSLALESAVAILRSAAHMSRMRNSLAVLPSDSPDGLTSGDSDVPPAAARLIAALVAAGSESFTLAKCAKCGLAKNLWHKEFTIAIGVPVYVCNPHSPWLKGSNENTNGLLRQYLPKGEDLNKFSAKDLQKIQRSLNGRPRKPLGYKMPEEKLAELVALST